MLLTLIILFAGVLLSGLTVFLFPVGKKAMKLLLSFSGAYLLSISVLNLIPEIYSSPFRYTGIFMLVGFFIQIIIEFFSEGIEHGHVHTHDRSEKVFPLVIMLALSLHSFIEGIPLVQFGGEHETKILTTLVTGIVLHNIPISVALMVMLRTAGISRTVAILWLILFAAMTPIGMVAGDALFACGCGSTEEISKYLMAVVVGIFLHISTTILFETGEEHRFNLIKLAAILLGVGAAIIPSIL